MKNNIMTIIKKEFVRFFGDKRLVFTTILMPGIMIYALYTFMGQGLMKQLQPDKAYVYEISVENMPQSLKPAFDQLKADVKAVDSDKADAVETKLKDKGTDLLVVFPKDFDTAVAAYDSQKTKNPAPQIQMYYNSTKTESQTAYQMLTQMFDNYEASLSNKFDINSGNTKYDMASDKDETGKFFGMMLPMLMMMFLYSGCMAIAPESIAGEKERGTIATLLVTPMKRSQLAIGKIISLGVIGLLSGLSSFVGTMLSLPNLMGGDGSKAMNASVYQPLDYVVLLLVILTTVLVMVSAMSLISAFAKSVKEAGTTIIPLMVVILVVAVSSMMSNGAPKEPYWYLIPFYNSVQCMNGIFSFTYVPVNVALTLVSNLIYSLILAAGLAKVFDSEKIMYL
jgi:sodium transport system permease protein